METKPFSIQAPESIAKEYGGNKQKIAQASQMGLVDPTAALLAGMFIDRMRSAQMQEQAPPQTIAQQVFAPPAPQAPPSAPPPPPMGGPGGPPPMPGGPGGPGMPPPPQMNAPQGMAEGGLASLPVPDAMFDEPVDAQSFGGGGIVSFAAGTPPPAFDVTGANKAAIFGDLTALSSQSSAAAKARDEAKAAMAASTTNRAAYDAAKRQYEEANKAVIRINREYASIKDFGSPGSTQIPYDEIGGAGSSPSELYAPTLGEYTPRFPPGAPAAAPGGAPRAAPAAAPGGAPHAPRPVAPGGLGKTAVAQQAAAALGFEPTAVADQGTAITPEDAIKRAKGLFPIAADPARQALEAAMRGGAGDAEKQRKQDMWMALAQMGAGMASSKNPSFFGAVGEASQAALPGIQQARTARKAEERQNLRDLAGIESQRASEKMQQRQAGIQLYGSLSAEQASKAALAASRAEHIDQVRYQNANLTQQRELAIMQRDAQILASRIAAASSGRATDHQQDVETMFQSLKAADARLPANQRKTDAELRGQAITLLAQNSPTVQAATIKTAGDKGFTDAVAAAAGGTGTGGTGRPKSGKGAAGTAGNPIPLN